MALLALAHGDAGAVPEALGGVESAFFFESALKKKKCEFFCLSIFNEKKQKKQKKPRSYLRRLGRLVVVVAAGAQGRPELVLVLREALDDDGGDGLVDAEVGAGAVVFFLGAEERRRRKTRVRFFLFRSPPSSEPSEASEAKKLSIPFSSSYGQEKKPRPLLPLVENLNKTTLLTVSQTARRTCAWSRAS